MAVVDIVDEEEINDPENFEDLHPEIRNVIKIREVHTDALNDHVECIEHPVETQPSFATEAAGRVPQILATSSPALSDQGDFNVGLDITFPFEADTNLASDTGLCMAAENLSFRSGRPGTVECQYLAILSRNTEVNGQEELNEIRNQPRPNATSRLDHATTVGRQSIRETDHDLNRPLDLSEVTASSMTTEARPEGQMSIPENCTDERTQSPHKDDAQCLEKASGSEVHGGQQRRVLSSQRMETKLDDDLEENLSNDEYSLSTDQQLGDASGRKTSGKKE